MNLIARWRAYMGPKDERLEAESNRCIRVGYIILLFGSLAALYYGSLVGQVAYTTDNALITPLGERVVNTHSVLQVVTMISVLTVCVLEIRKGILSEHARFAQVERIPWDFIALISLVTGFGMGVLVTFMRILAEIQIVGVAEVTWAGDIAMGVVFFGLVFLMCLVAMAIMFHCAIKRRKELEDQLEE